MKVMDKDGLLLCELQAVAFEMSLVQVSTSSEIFIRRFMNSKTAEMLDQESILVNNTSSKDINLFVEEEYQLSTYGSIKYTKEELYWIGYLYRYFSYTHELTSKSVYKTIKPKELRRLYLAYHTLSPAQAIERILESKGKLLNEKEELERKFKIYKRIRGNI